MRTRYPLPFDHPITHILFLTTALLCAAAALHAQPSPQLDPATAGTLYYVAFPDTTANTLDVRYPNNRVRTEATLWLFSAVKNSVKITSPLSGVSVYNLEAGKMKEISTSSLVLTVSNTVSHYVYKVESTYPIVLYCYWANIQSVEAWTPISVDRWGKRYIAAAIPGETVKEIGIAGETLIPTIAKPAPAEILVIAAFDSTHVTLKPPRGVALAGDPPLSFMLAAGEAYQVQSIVDTLLPHDVAHDIAGMVITADKPIGVMSGNTRAEAVRDTTGTKTGLEDNAYRNMMMEWLAPTEQYGRQFAALPTWDGHRAGIAATSQRDSEYVRIYNSTSAPMHGTYSTSAAPTLIPFTIAPDSLGEIPISESRVLAIRTDAPAQVMMHPSAIVYFNGSTPCFRGIPCLSYSAWGPYMSEMTSREQWTSFAPYYAPSNPGTMQHFVSVVTDTASARNVLLADGSPFLFNRLIPGTDLIWGTRSVNPGTTNWLQGRNGARFGGIVLGEMQGGEEYRPGAARRKDDGASIAGGGSSGGPHTAHPAEYEEYNGGSYGYPLAPRRSVLRPPDSLHIDTTADCSTLTLSVRTVNANPVGLRSVALDPLTVRNAKLTAVTPANLQAITFMSQCTVRVEAVDVSKSVHADIVITDRTDRITTVTYDYTPPHPLTIPAPVLDFGAIKAGSAGTDTVVVDNTASTVAAVITSAALRHGPVSDFSLVGRTLPFTVAAGASDIIIIHYGPAVAGRTSLDTLDLTVTCGRAIVLPVSATGVPRGAGVADAREDGLACTISRGAHGSALQLHLTTAGTVHVGIADALGRHTGTIVDERMEAGDHTLPLDETGMASGVYYCTVTTAAGSRTVSWVVVH